MKSLKAIELVLKHEGGLSLHPADKGGPTKYGISLKFLRQHKMDMNGDSEIDEVDVSTLTRDEAIEIYLKEFWCKYKYDAINDEKIAIKVFDLCVNMGPIRIHKILQTAMNELAGRNIVAVDGILGPKTISHLNSITWDAFNDQILSCIIEGAAEFYFSLAEAYPSNKVFLKGWLRRVAD